MSPITYDLNFIWICLDDMYCIKQFTFSAFKFNCRYYLIIWSLKFFILYISFVNQCLLKIKVYRPNKNCPAPTTPVTMVTISNFVCDVSVVHIQHYITAVINKSDLLDYHRMGNINSNLLLYDRSVLYIVPTPAPTSHNSHYILIIGVFAL